MQASQKQRSAGRISPTLAVIIVVCLVLGLTIWYFLNQAASQATDFAAPAERQGLNAPFITTPDVVVDKMVELAEIADSDLVYDLGCGDGRLVITAAMKTGCSGVGFDIEPKRVAEATENAKLHEVDGRVQIIEQDVFTVDLSEADVVMTYLLPWMMNKLIPQFQQMRDGCRIVAHDFWIDGVEPEKVFEFVEAEGRGVTSVYLYRTPLRLDSTIEKGKPPQPRDGQVERQEAFFPEGAYQREEKQ